MAQMYFFKSSKSFLLIIINLVAILIFKFIGNKNFGDLKNQHICKDNPQKNVSLF